MPLNSKQIAKLRELAPTHSYKQIAVILGVKETSLPWYARTHGINMNNEHKFKTVLADAMRKLTPDDVRFVREAKGIYTQSELAERYGVSTITIRRAQNAGRGYENV